MSALGIQGRTENGQTRDGCGAERARPGTLRALPRRTSVTAANELGLLSMRLACGTPRSGLDVFGLFDESAKESFEGGHDENVIRDTD
jgi:hypothetical protein